MLKQCNNCENKISEYAHRCPKCGIKNEKYKLIRGIDVFKKGYEKEIFSYMLDSNKDFSYILNYEKELKQIEEQKRRGEEKLKIKKQLKKISYFLIAFSIIVGLLLISNKVQSEKDKTLIDLFCKEFGNQVIDNTVYISKELENEIRDGVNLFGKKDVSAQWLLNDSHRVIGIRFYMENKLDITRVVNELNMICGNYNKQVKKDNYCYEWRYPNGKRVLLNSDSTDAGFYVVVKNR